MDYREFAYDLTMEGLNPLPLKENKAPKLPVGHKFLYQVVTDIDNLFHNCAKIGIACGNVSGGFYGLDFDAHKGENIKSVYDDFINIEYVKHLISDGKLSCYSTAGGGYHIYFNLSGKLKGSVLSKWETGEVMIEVRGEGQYLACHPTKGYDYLKGVEYVKLNSISENELLQVIKIAESFSQAETQKETIDGKKRKWTGEWDNSTISGRYNNESVEESRELLVAHGWNYISSRKVDDVELWVRPGKDEKDGISATWGQQKNMFYVFSTSAEPFEKGAYSPFNIYTILNFSGDWKRAKDSLKPKEIITITENKVRENGKIPLDVFPLEIRNFMNLLNSTLNYNTDFLAIGFMFTVATIIGNKFKVRVKVGWETPPLFWFVALGNPGTQKTHPLKTMLKPLQALDSSSKKVYDSEMVEFDDNDGKGKAPKFKQMVVSDSTLEALHYVHDTNRRGLGMYKDELKGFLNSFNKYRKGADEEFWLESFNNSSYIVNRVTKEPLLINDTCINIIGTMQPDVVEDMLNTGSKNGLIDRFLFTRSEDTIFPMNLNDMDQRVIDFYNNFVKDAEKELSYLSSDDTEVFPLSKKCLQKFIAFDAKIIEFQRDETKNLEITNYASKMKTYYPRFALLFAAIDYLFDGGEMEITEGHMDKAELVCNYFLKNGESLFNEMDEKTEIKEVAVSLKGNTKKEKIIHLAKKGYSGSEIAKTLKTHKSYVSKTLKEYNNEG